MSTQRRNSDSSIESAADRDRRALEECMSVLPQGGDIYEVVSQSGASYRVDTRAGRCTCPDHEHRDVRCKHIRRARFADGQRPIPPQIEPDDVDDQLGEHTDDDAYQLVPDGGTDAEAGDPDPVEECLERINPHDPPQGFSTHVEPREVGGARYWRCEHCGAESIRWTERMMGRQIHHDDRCENPLVTAEGER
jgi:hypothetical protein